MKPNAEPIKYAIIGFPYSTFTRTVTMGLHELGVPFEQIPAKPHTAEVMEFSPFGMIPVLTLEHSGKKMPMTETLAIANYLDAGDQRILRFPQRDLIRNQKVDEWISIISNYVFTAVEKGVVKRRIKDESADISSAIDKMTEVLAIVEDRMAGPYIMGTATTVKNTLQTI